MTSGKHMGDLTIGDGDEERYGWRVWGSPNKVGFLVTNCTAVSTPTTARAAVAEMGAAGGSRVISFGGTSQLTSTCGLQTPLRSRYHMFTSMLLIRPSTLSEPSHSVCTRGLRQ